MQADRASDILFVPRQDFRLRIVDGERVNEKDLEAQGNALADNYLAKTLDPMRIIICKGFADVPLSGLISSIEFDQESVTTTLRLNDWYKPSGVIDYQTLGKLERGGAGESYPNQSETQETRNAEGAVGGTQPAVILSGGGLDQGGCSAPSETNTLSVRCVVDVVWDNVAGQLYYNWVPFDSCGKAMIKSTPQKQIIDTPEDCL